MIHFVDTSALVKLYIAEEGTEAMQDRLARTVVAVSQLTYAEAHAAFARLLRDGLLQAQEYEIIRFNFERDWATALQLPLSEAILTQIPVLCLRHPLRGADALQLASALMLRDEGVGVSFVTSDHQLVRAGEAERLAVFDPSK